MNIYIDIETLPVTNQMVIDEIAASIKPPANYSKPETVAKWLEENKADAVKAAVAKTSFDGLFGRIACICYAFDDDKEVFEESNDDEEVLLSNFYCKVFAKTVVDTPRGLVDVPATIVGHNVVGFDLPFLKHRSIIIGQKPVPAIYKAMHAKPWDACIADTMLMWSQDREKRVSMDKLCRAFGIPGKGDFDGSMVVETWPVDRNKVIDYCKDDVRRTRAMYKRMTFAARDFA